MKRSIILGLLLFCINCSQSKRPNAESISLNNRGVGLMGQFKYAEAAECFLQLSTREPDWITPQINAAIAVLNRQGEGDEERAIQILETVLNKEPKQARALYTLGLLYLYRGDEEKAESYFKATLAEQPNDPFCLYQMADLMLKRNESESLEAFQKLTQKAPYLRSGHYGLFRAAKTFNQPEIAKAALAEFEALKDNPQARTFAFKYRQMGDLAEAKTDVAKPVQAPTPTTVQFGPANVITNALGETSSWSGFSTVDLNGDQKIDIFVYGLNHSPNHSLIAQANGEFLATDIPHLNQQPNLRFCLWGDLDQDGSVEAILVSADQISVFSLDSAEWQPASFSFDTPATAGWSDGLLVDADQDGDLDLVLLREADSPVLFNNDRNGVFRNISEETGLAQIPGARSLWAEDYDRDRDLDLLFACGNHWVLAQNNRAWHYSLKKHDEASEWIATWDPTTSGKYQLLRSAAQILFLGNGDSSSQSIGETIRAGFTQDWTGSGQAAITLLGENNILFIQDGKITRLPSANTLAMAPFCPKIDQGPGLLCLQADGSLVFHPPRTGNAPFLAVTPSGMEDTSNTTRSNTSGIGTRLNLRCGSTWSNATYLPKFGRGQSLQPLVLGCPGTKADFISLEWSDGVYQTELDLKAGQAYVLTETQRQLSSCPVLFSWNGFTYEFVSDVLGVGGMGFNLGRQEYAPPRPFEAFAFSHDQIHVQNKQIRIKITEPMEEATYLDHVQLLAYDLPADWHMVLDERMGIGDPQPTSQALFYRQAYQPIAAKNQEGEDVLQSLLKRDLQAAPLPDHDHRFVGRLAEEHILEFAFDLDLAELGPTPLLIIDGWIEYPYSQTMFAAWQAGASYDPPSLDFQDAAGTWHTMRSQWGYPAGMPRQIALPLDAMPPGTHRLRLRTNMEIYWDRLQVARSEPLDVAPTHIPLKRAMVESVGFPKWTFGPQRQPQFDWTERIPENDTRHQSGFYTAFGDCLPLLHRADDQLAIFGPGEAIDWVFELPEGSTLINPTWVLQLTGWCKDMDLLTDRGETLGPLPHQSEQPPPTDLMNTFNTRYAAGR
ncbi:MAG: VCBS repeat-containing protein [Acidobacteria bacterium]|nr:VCBS repeat-containing protein [Acidobacteriota bacterium]MCB9396956.1 VCBS repeat-containing protein [Acidobacteriota bacterium]